MKYLKSLTDLVVNYNRYRARQRLYNKLWRATDIILSERHTCKNNKEFHPLLNDCLDQLDYASRKVKETYAKYD